MSADIHYRALTAGEEGKIDIIYIGNIPTNISQEEIEKFFSEVKIVELKLINNGIKTYGMAKCINNEEAGKALELYRDKELNGRRLVLRKFKNKKGNDGDTSEAENVSEISGNSDSRDVNKFSKSKNSHSAGGNEMPKLEDCKHDSTSSDHQDRSSIFNSRNKYKQKSVVNTKKLNKFSGGAITNGFGRAVANSSKQNHLSTNIKCNDTSSSKSNAHIALLVGNFPIGTTKGELNALFWDYNVSQIEMVNNSNSKRSTQAFLYFSNLQDPYMAIEKYDKAQYLNHNLFVAFVDPAYVTNKEAKLTGSKLKKKTPKTRDFDKKVSSVDGMSSINERLRQCSIQSSDLIEESHSSNHVHPDRRSNYVNRTNDRHMSMQDSHRFLNGKKKRRNGQYNNSSKLADIKSKHSEEGSSSMKNEHRKKFDEEESLGIFKVTRGIDVVCQ
ncbi:XP_029637449.1uncharacterized protein LOC115212823 isoform X2 [Octopus vulgaris]|nr:XP_029637449.1uncharacterized protein LOC115212823 isoform X2 [Octopus vulgaris]